MRRVGIVVALCVSVVFGLPQIRYFADGHLHAVIQDGDEMSYAAKVRDAIDGHWRAASPYVWEHKSAPAFTPYGGEMFLGSISWLTRLDLDSLIILTRFLAPAVSALLLMRILFALTGSSAWSALGAGMVLLEPGTYYYKPVYYFTMLLVDFPPLSDMPLLYSRFLNPLLLIIPFLVSVLFLFRALERHRRTDVIIAGLTFGVNFYAQPYYSTYLLAWLLLLLLFYFRHGTQRGVLVSIALLGLLVGGYAIVENFQKFQGQGLEVVTRFGGYLRTRAPFNLFHKGVILSGLAFALFYRDKRSLAYRFLLSGMLGGYVLLNQHLMTNREIHSYHYNYSNAIVASCALVALAKDWLSAGPRWVSAERWALGLRVAGAALAVWLVVNALVLQSRSYSEHMRSALPSEGGYSSNVKEWFPRTITWINANAAKDAVFLADPYVSFVIPVYTHANVFLNPDLYDDAIAFMSDQELFERYMVHLKLRGATPTEVFQMVRFKPPVPFPSWKFGRNVVMRRAYDLTAADSFSTVLEANSLAMDYVAAFKGFSRQDVETGLRKYRVDYLAVSEKDKQFRSVAPGYFLDGTLKRIAAIPEEGVEIFRISRPIDGQVRAP